MVRSILGKRSVIIRQLLLVLVASLYLISCVQDEPDDIKRTNLFLIEFLNENGVRIFNSEINRTRVHYFPHTKTLIYSFWKPEKLADNGRLYLHVYPEDLEDLSPNRRKYGFDNLSIRKSDMFTNDSIHFYLARELDLPYSIQGIVTGQYKGKKKTWKADFRDRELINKVKHSELMTTELDLECKTVSNPNFETLLVILRHSMTSLETSTLEDRAVYRGKSKNYALACQAISKDIIAKIQCDFNKLYEASPSKIIRPIFQISADSVHLELYELDVGWENCKLHFHIKVEEE